MCGQGHISEVLKSKGYQVRSSDLIDRGYGECADVFNTALIMDCDVISNPPYKKAQDIIKHLLDVSAAGTKIAMFLKLLFLESKARYKLFKEYPPKTIYVASGRLICAKNGDFEKYKAAAIAHAWFVWEKGFKGSPTIQWINT